MNCTVDTQSNEKLNVWDCLVAQDRRRNRNHGLFMFSCQSQQNNPALSSLIPWQWPTRPWSGLHIDYEGPFLGQMWLVIIDTHSKWIAVFSN